MQTVSVIGLPVAATNYAGAVAWILEHAEKKHAYAVEASNTHVAALARTNADFAAVMARFDLICPDGMPLVWALNSRLPAADRLTDRVYGPTLMLETLAATAGNPAFRHFLLGGRQKTLDTLTEKFSTRFPGTVIAGTHSPPFGEWPESEFNTISEKIRTSGANLIWVGLGCPKQEHWIAANKDRLPPTASRRSSSAMAAERKFGIGRTPA